MRGSGPAQGAGGPGWRKVAPLVVLAAALASFFALGGHHWVSVDALRDNRQLLQSWVNAHPVLTALGFAVLYAALVAIAFPSTIVLTIAAGYLFGFWGVVPALIGATLGAVGLFLAARSAFAQALARRFGGILARLEKGFAGNAFLYLLSLRLFPLAPFVGVTLAAAAVRMKLREFAAATALGTLPATAVYNGVGAGAGAVLDQGGEFSLGGIIAQPAVFAPLMGLAALAAAPALWRSWRARGAGPG